MFNFRRNHVTKCTVCNVELVPKNIISLKFSSFIGFIATAIPGHLALRFYNDFLTSISIGALTGSLAILGLAVYTYLTTEFLKKGDTT